MSGEKQANTKFCAVCGETFLLEQGNSILYSSGFFRKAALGVGQSVPGTSSESMYVSETSAKMRNACCA